MKAQQLFKKAAAGLGTVALTLALGACSHTPLAQQTDSGQIRTEQSAQAQATSGNTVATAPAPSNAQGVTTNETPAIISGPAKVDNSGRVYTSSAVGSTGNASSTGLNTNVNIIPKESKSTVTVTQTEMAPAPAPYVSTTESTTITTATPAAPVVTETRVETTAPMASSTTDTSVTTTTESTTSKTTSDTNTTTTRRRMRKD